MRETLAIHESVSTDPVRNDEEEVPHLCMPPVIAEVGHRKTC